MTLQLCYHASTDATEQTHRWSEIQGYQITRWKRYDSLCVLLGISTKYSVSLKIRNADKYPMATLFASLRVIGAIVGRKQHVRSDFCMFGLRQ